jgi:hypothetical protein
MKKKLIIGALVVCLLVFVAVFAFSQNSSNSRWEYTQCRYQTDQLNQLGAQGWEAVSSDHRDNVLLKRRLP